MEKLLHEMARVSSLKKKEHGVFYINNYDQVIEFLNRKSVNLIKRYTYIICMLLPSLSNFDEQIRRQYICRYNKPRRFVKKSLTTNPKNEKK